MTRRRHRPTSQRRSWSAFELHTISDDRLHLRKNILACRLTLEGRMLLRVFVKNVSPGTSACSPSEYEERPTVEPRFGFFRHEELPQGSDNVRERGRAIVYIWKYKHRLRSCWALSKSDSHSVASPSEGRARQSLPASGLSAARPSRHKLASFPYPVGKRDSGPRLNNNSS